jgi:acyl-coenzyme A synthetase/AMP-(fatty) acid ligase/surfactin synthase thioesterase subunit
MRYDLADMLWQIPARPLDADHVLFIDEHGSGVTVGRFTAETAAWEDMLAAAGVRPGERVVCAARTSMRWIFALGGLFRLRAIPIVGRAQSPLTQLSESAQAVGAGHVLFVDDDLVARAVGGPVTDADESDRGTRLIFGQFTSGSTGSPKIVGHYETGMRAFRDSMPGLYQVAADSIVLTTADISFGYGFGNSVLIPLVTGATCVLWTDPARVDDLLETMGSRRVTIAALSPRVWAGIARRIRSGSAKPPVYLRTALSAGEPLPNDLRAALEAQLGLKMTDGYGATEILHIVAVRESSDPGLVPLPGTSLAVTQAPGDSPSTVLAITGSMASSRYLVAPEEDQHRLKDGTFVSNDAATITGGRPRIIGRADFLINRGGTLLSPVELESLVRETTGMESVAVELPPSAGGPAKLALGVVVTAAGGSPAQISKDVRSGLLAVVAGRRFLLPDVVAALSSLPLTETGKLDRHAARARLARRVGSAVRWRDMSAGTPPRLVLFPCAGAAAEFYDGLRSAATWPVAAIEYDLAAVNDIDTVLDTAAEYLIAETAPNDLLVGHSIGAVILAAIAARHPGAVRGRQTFVLCPPHADLTQSERTRLSQEADRMLRSQFGESSSALERGRRLAAAEMKRADEWLSRLGTYLPEFAASVEIAVEDDPVSKGGKQATSGRVHLQLASGGHYLPITDPARTVSLIARNAAWEQGRAKTE